MQSFKQFVEQNIGMLYWVKPKISYSRAVPEHYFLMGTEAGLPIKVYVKTDKKLIVKLIDKIEIKYHYPLYVCQLINGEELIHRDINYPLTVGVMNIGVKEKNVVYISQTHDLVPLSPDERTAILF